MKTTCTMVFDKLELSTLRHALKAWAGDGTFRTAKAANLLKRVEQELKKIALCDSPKKNTREF